MRHRERRRDEGAGRGRRSGRGAARAHSGPRQRGRRDASGNAGRAVSRRDAAERRRSRHDRVARHRRGQGAHAAHLRYALRPVRQVLRPRSGPRPDREHRRGGRRDRRAVDRRAGHAAHHAHLPHRRRRLAYRGGEPGGREVQRHGALHRADALCHQRQGREDRDFALRRNPDHRRQRPRARAPQGALRRDPDRRPTASRSRPGRCSPPGIRIPARSSPNTPAR